MLIKVRIRVMLGVRVEVKWLLWDWWYSVWVRNWVLGCVYWKLIEFLYFSVCMYVIPFYKSNPCFL